ncbi:MAG: hypothetical protein NVSMB30_21630 [Hymenobacter sp.]
MRSALFGLAAIMKTFTLDVEYEFDFALFGLVSSSRDYTLAWTLNRALRLRLVKQPELLLNLVSHGRLAFTHYLHATDTLSFRLLRNRSNVPSPLKKPFLAPDIKEYDYLLAVSNGSGAYADAELVQHLTTLDAVQYVCQFDPNTLKYKENLMW